MGSLWSILIFPFKVVYWCVTYLVDAVKAVWGKFYAGRSIPNSHGTAKWATEKDLKDNFTPEGFYVAKFGKKRIYTGPERNVLLCSNPGQGKTQTLVATMLDIASRERVDLLVNDPAGDIEKATRQSFVQSGYRVWCINIANPPQTDVRYNPFSFLDPKLHFDYERDVQSLANLILPDDVHTREEHFQNFARMMLVAAIMKAGSRSLYEVVEILSDPIAMRKFFDAKGAGDSLIVRQAYKAFEAAGDKERGSFITTLARKLVGWGQKAMRYLLQDDPNAPWKWEDLFRDEYPTVIFMRAGLGTNEGAVARLILGNAINTRRRMWNKGEDFKRPLKLIIDEALTLGNCAAIQDAVNELRKAKVNVFMCWLSLQSMRDTLSQSENIINACELIVFGGGRDMKLYREVSELMGDRTIESGSRSESDHGESKSASEQGRRLIKPDELRGLPYEQMAMTLGPLNVKAYKPFRRGKKGIEY
jgi:type IV secretory pathway TraG/TraD family ATPase VirD4